MNGYTQVQMTMPDGSSMQVWQQIVNGEVVGYVDGTNQVVQVPPIREERCVNGQLMANPQ